MSQPFPQGTPYTGEPGAGPATPSSPSRPEIYHWEADTWSIGFTLQEAVEAVDYDRYIQRITLNVYASANGPAWPAAWFGRKSFYYGSQLERREGDTGPYVMGAIGSFDWDIESTPEGYGINQRFCEAHCPNVPLLLPRTQPLKLSMDGNTKQGTFMPKFYIAVDVEFGPPGR